MIVRDMRGTREDREVRDFYTALLAPGTGHLHAGRDPVVHPSGAAVYFTGLGVPATLEDGIGEAVCRLDLATCRVTRLRDGARSLQLAPDGASAALVTQQGRAVEVLSLDDGRCLAQWTAPGLVEQLGWAPDGACLLALVAGAEADKAGAEGGYALRQSRDGPSWLPETVSTVDDSDVWRRLFLWRTADAEATALTAPPFNAWEFAWLGPTSVAVVASRHHGEGSWYRATLDRVDLSGRVETLVTPQDQVGLPTGSADGRLLAFVEAVCSDRGLVCGTLRLLDLEDGRLRTLDTRGADVSSVAWRGPRRLHYAGLRHDETVFGDYDLDADRADELLASATFTCGDWQPVSTPDGGDGALAFIESYDRAPALARLTRAGPEVLHSLAAPDSPRVAGRIGYLQWLAPDGLEVGGWLIRPDDRPGPVPLLVDIHGGPISAHRNRWVARLRAVGPLVASGYAVLLPNPRGSTGRGQDFARRIVGDMGGADTGDFLAGIDHLIAQGIADPHNLFVTGTSYGGFMSAWLVARDRRFAAAVPISPVANWYSQHYSSQIPWFDAAFLAGSPDAAGGPYFERSPIFVASRVTTPTLIMAGGRDKNVPTLQAVELYNALCEAGAETALSIYPEDGHSLRGYPAYVDSAVRVMTWLRRHERRAKA